MKKYYYYRYRSAITGLYVTESYAKKHPKTTIREKYFKQFELFRNEAVLDRVQPRFFLIVR